VSLRVAANLSLLYPHLAFPDRFAAAAADGFRAVELLFPYDVEPDVLAGWLRAAGLEHVLVNTPPGPNGERGFAGVPGAEEAFRHGFDRALAVCAATGCRIVHTMAGDPPVDATYDACVDTLLANLAWAAPQAAARGIVLTLEALNHLDMPGYLYSVPAQTVAVVERLGHPSVRVQFDLFHTAREGLDLVAELHAALPITHHVQIAGAPDRHEPDLAYPGLTDALVALDSSGYAGWFGFEYRPAGDTTTGLAWCGPLAPLFGR
jgi:hydroxypyruvate isomerase